LAEDAGELKEGNPAMLLEQLSLLARHKAVGMTILLLACVRFLWRRMTPPPVLPQRMRPWQMSLARATHALMYALLFALPLSGWLMSSAANFPVSYFGLFTFPDLVAPDETFAQAMKSLHHFLGPLLFVTVVIHVLAVLKHHFIDKDTVLKRMLPWTA